MKNPYYSYENIYLWDQDVWKGHYSPVRFLFHHIEKINHENFRMESCEDEYSKRTDGRYNAKTLSNLYQDYIDDCKGKGLAFRTSEMANLVWVALTPEEAVNGENRTPNVLVVLSDADYSDPDWMIRVLKKNGQITERAARERFAVLYINMTDVSLNDIPFGVIQEFSVYYNLMMDHIFLDLRPLVQTGGKLGDISGFIYRDENGNTVNDPDSCITELGGVPALEISHQWQNMLSGTIDIHAGWLQHPKFDKEAFMHSPAGRETAAGLEIEYKYKKADDEDFCEMLKSMGVSYVSHDYRSLQWFSCTPASLEGTAAPGNAAPAEKLPAVLIFQEVTYQDPHQGVAAVAAYRNYVNLAAAGELIALFFAMESVEMNDLFYDILLEAAREYPIDLSRVYVTGHSHNGYFAERFAHRFHDKIAAVAPLGIHPGLPEPAWTTSPIPVTDEIVEESAGYDLPVIVVTSEAEIRNDALHCRQDDEYFSSAARAYQRRLKAQQCAERSVEEIIAAEKDSDPVRAKIGYPVDRAFTEYHSGAPVFIGDVANKDGREHFRIAIPDNHTHFISGLMPDVSWEYMKRFARDLESGRIIEL